MDAPGLLSLELPFGAAAGRGGADGRTDLGGGPATAAGVITNSETKPILETRATQNSERAASVLAA